MDCFRWSWTFHPDSPPPLQGLACLGLVLVCPDAANFELSASIRSSACSELSLLLSDMARLGLPLLLRSMIHLGPAPLVVGISWSGLTLSVLDFVCPGLFLLLQGNALCPRLSTPGFTFVSTKSQLLWQLDTLARSSTHGLGLLTVSDRHHYSRQFSIGQKSCKA